MTRRRRILLSAAGAAGLAFALPYAVWHPHRLNHDGFAKVENGMTQEEVEQLFGGPPGWYYPTYPGAGQGKTDEAYIAPSGVVEMLWFDDKKRYEVWFDDQGKVVGKHQRSGWYSTAVSCRLFAMVYGIKEPTPLAPKKYERPAFRWQLQNQLPGE